MAPTTDEVSCPNPGFLQRHHFLIRRLHSLTGIIPIGAFLCEHLLTNSQILFGADEFNHDVHFLHSLPALELMEIFGIWVPIGFHAVLGMIYTLSGAKLNTTAYPYAGNLRYTLQRVTGILAFVFIFVHLWTVQWGLPIGPWHTPFEVHDPAGSAARALQAYWWVLPMYIIGVTSCVYHFANGLWTAAITWGLTLSQASQRRWGVLCAAIGILLGIAGITSAVAFSRLNVEPQSIYVQQSDQYPAPVPTKLSGSDDSSSRLNQEGL